MICGDNCGAGLQIKNSSGITVADSLFKESDGSYPGAGIFISASSGGTVSDVLISNTWVLDSASDGIVINGADGIAGGITIQNCVSNDNGGSGLYLSTCDNISVLNTRLSNNENNGIEFVRDVNDASFDGVGVSANGLRGVSLIVTRQKEGTGGICFDQCLFSDNSQSAPGNYDGVRIDNYDSSMSLGNIRFSACSFFDDQQTPTQRYGLTVGNNKTHIGNITVETDCLFSGNAVSDMVSSGLGTVKAPGDTGDYLNIKDAGAKGDGVTDATSAIQRALKSYSKIFVPSGTYMIDATPGLSVSSNQTIVFEDGAVFKVIPTSEKYYMIFNFSGKSNVNVTGGVFVGDRYSHQGTEGEWGTARSSAAALATSA